MSKARSEAFLYLSNNGDNPKAIEKLCEIAGISVSDLVKEITGGDADDLPFVGDLNGVKTTSDEAHLNAGLSEAVFKLLLKNSLTVDEVAECFALSCESVQEAIDDLRGKGVNILIQGDKVSISKKPYKVGPDDPYDHSYYSRDDHTYKFGIVGDTHLGSKYERLDVLNNLYDAFQEEGVDRVFHTGNWIDGEAPFNKGDLVAHGLEGQLEYLAENYPQREGITTYAVTGDDHEGWYSKLGVDVGRFAEYTMRSYGRYDWVNLGYMEAFVPLINKETGVESYLLVSHPGGGSTYAVSHRPQKIVDGMVTGELPHIALFGHLHKMNFCEHRGVMIIQSGCTQDQTPFMRKKTIIPAIGGSIFTARQDPETGNIYRGVYEPFQYQNIGRINNRWNPGSKVALPTRI